VFIDVSEIIAGSEFPDKLKRELTDSDLMIVVMGIRWIDLLKEKSKSVERDFVRVEIEIAISNKIPIIPLLTGAASMPKEYELPDSIKALSNIHAISFKSDAVDHSINQLLNGIEDCIRRRNERQEAEQVAAAKRES